jgi:hypothetical protein
MRRLATTFVIASFIGLGAVVWGQGQGNGQGNGYAYGQDPFFDKGDNGETIHVLPTPAALHSGRDTGATFAVPGDAYTVFSASYGSGALIDHGGPEIPTAKFYPIYWNSSVSSSTETSGGHSSIEQQMVDFVQSFSGSSSYTMIQQYGTQNQISATIANQGSVIRSEPTKGSIRDGQIQSFLSGLFAAGAVPADPNAVYGIYFPPGMKIQLQGMSCSSFCGYHNYYTYGNGANAKRIKYAVFPYLNCSACKISANAIVADMLTIVVSHEIREAVTDPQLNAWFDSSGYEADDKCAWHNLYYMPGTNLLVQPEYSNQHGGCVVPDAPKPHHQPTRRH